MSQYVKLADDYTFWYINKDGEREIVTDLNQHGILPIRIVSPKELEAIPFVGESDEEE